ncbi:MAG: M67 family metallopeptidase [Magnetospirillum sp. WYHS-4]
MIALPASVLAAIRAQAEAAYPEECCGLLVGSVEANGRVAVVRHVPSPNLAEGDRRRSFEVSPQVRFDLMRSLRATGEALVGHYHSHPDGPAAPSAADRVMVWEPELVWLVVAVRDGKAGIPQAYRPDASEGFRRLELKTGI